MCQYMMGHVFYCKGSQIFSEYIICTLLVETILTHFFIDYPAEDKNLFNDTHREAGVSLNSVQEWLVGCF